MAAAPIRNPFYFLLLIACGGLLITIFTYLVGWFYVPTPTYAIGEQAAPMAPMPPWMEWIDDHALWLIVGEVSVILVLVVLTIGLDRFFDEGPSATSGDQNDTRDATLVESEVAEDGEKRS
ncbi:hypothetical protein Pan216_33720 [Planctomycetes bacterium Pan216]|uniref:Uncharacterized protein n=1 Tax=Kolteria novifilia TaxID=2527975 RepID=A0A518B6A3_9BACT|nr:hypothetical protein Pan216_33720 [Planctomycetes bacterium Pan216]